MIMGNFRPFRYWYYFRQGYQLYFAFVFAALNTLVVTYFLAIERAPFLKEVFPTFPIYAVVLIVVGVPLLILAGFLHFKKMPAFKSEQEVAVESNPYVYKLQPGYMKHVIMPYNLLMSKIIIKLSQNEKLTEGEIKEMGELQKKMEHLIEGGYVGDKEKSRLPFDFEKKD